MLLQTILSYFSLEGEIDDYEKIHSSIEKDIVFKGTNLWILVFAILVASVGLNMNSTAVIIGAMLISPLMGPINGMGYSIATYNFPLFRRSLKNFSFAAGASIVASTTYFAISPVSTAHSELLARTSPTIYDVLIALFGGLAGIVAISSKFKGNVIPGVAIATALMPPLCTAGYGLATAQFTFFFGALYLFTINSVFIALASVVISQLLKFPITTIVDKQQRKTVNRWISIVITITLVPSIYFGYGLVQKERFSENASRFIQNVSIFEGNYLLNHKIDAKRKTIELTYGGSSLSDEHKQQLRDKLSDFNLADVALRIDQGLTIGLTGTEKELDLLRTEVLRLERELNTKNQELSAFLGESVLGQKLLNELQILFPSVNSCAYAKTRNFAGSGSGSRVEDLHLIVIGVNAEEVLGLEEIKRIERWVSARLGEDKVVVWVRRAS
jgi:uncharacterized hydrophobic protein (TIGR00271 family)